MSDDLAMLAAQLRICAECARSSPDDATYLNDPAREALKKAVCVVEAARTVLDTFRKDEAQGYRSRDRQFAIDILGKAIEFATPEQGVPK